MDTMGVATMVDESRFTLYDEPSLRLAALPATDTDVDAFLQRLVDVGPAEVNNAQYEVRRTAAPQVLRVVRTFNNVSFAFNYVIAAQSGPGGSRVVRLQPIIVWRTRPASGATEPLTAADARLQLGLARPDLLALAQQVLTPQ
jgi:hypothetical protein